MPTSYASLGAIEKDLKRLEKERDSARKEAASLKQENAALKARLRAISRKVRDIADSIDSPAKPESNADIGRQSQPVIRESADDSAPDGAY